MDNKPLSCLLSLGVDGTSFPPCLQHPTVLSRSQIPSAPPLCSAKVPQAESGEY